MPIDVQNTPNPNALKFSVGSPVGGPATFVSGGPADHPTAAALLEIEGVASVFMTADFVTLTKMPDADWDAIAPTARDVLEAAFG